MGILNKVKYILNQDIIDESSKDLIFTKQLIDQNQFKLEASIPQISPALFYNRLYEGIPICLDENIKTCKVRLELSKIANQIWNIENMDELVDEVEYYENQKNPKKKKRAIFDKSQR